MNGPPFALFGTAHLWTIAVIVAVSIALPLWVRRSWSQAGTRRLEVGLAIFVVVQELAKVWLWVGVAGRPIKEFLPLHLCSVAVFLTAALLVWRNFRTYELVYFWGLGGTLQAILTPDLDRGFPSPLYLAYFVGHGVIIVGALYATLVFRFRPQWRSVPRVWLTTAVYSYLFVMPLNLVLDTNYLYLRAKPAGATLFDYLGPWPWYLASVALLAWVFFLMVYFVPFGILDLLARYRSGTAPDGEDEVTPGEGLGYNDVEFRRGLDA